MAYLPDLARSNPLFSGPPAVLGRDLFGPNYISRAPMIQDIASPASIASGESYAVTEGEAEDPRYVYTELEANPFEFDFFNPFRGWVNIGTRQPFDVTVEESIDAGDFRQLTKQDLVDAIAMRVIDDEAQLTRQEASLYGGMEGRRAAMNALFTDIKEVMNTFDKSKLIRMFRFLEDPGRRGVELDDNEKARLRSLNTITLRRPFRL